MYQGEVLCSNDCMKQKYSYRKKGNEILSIFKMINVGLPDTEMSQ